MLTPRTRQVVFNPVGSGIDLTPEQEPVDTSFGACGAYYCAKGHWDGRRSGYPDVPKP
jgi:hypothetical protein